MERRSQEGRRVDSHSDHPGDGSGDWESERDGLLGFPVFGDDSHRDSPPLLHFRLGQTGRDPSFGYVDPEVC